MSTSTIEKTEGQGTLNIPGKSAIHWSKADDASVKAAVTAFREAKAEGMMAAAMSTGSTGTVIQDFDPEVEVITMTRQFAGG